MKKEFNHEKIKEAIRTILTELGDDPDREGLKDTPDRVARMYDEIFEGMRYTNDEIAEMFNKCFEVDSNDLVIVKDIEVFSHCEHHLALMYNMHCHVGYIPNGKVIGLSKIARICDMVSKRLQLQERICSDIAEAVSYTHLAKAEPARKFTVGVLSARTSTIVTTNATIFQTDFTNPFL